MTDVMLFPFAEYWWFYAGFTLMVLFFLALDLGVFHRQAHEVKIKEAVAWCITWISLAMLFNWGLYEYAHWKFAVDPRLLAIPGFDPAAAADRVALEYLTGFIVEKALSVDNVFVFAVVFTYFGIPAKYQHRVLFYGILGALIFRMKFISLGSLLLQYHFIVVIFGILLIATGVKVIFAPEKPLEPEKNPVIKFVRKILPITPNLEGQRFFLKKEDGKIYGTPLLLALILIEISDIIFAVDSVPAIFAITKEPLIVFTSNIFAILGLRALYFLLSDIMHRFRYLKYGLGAILVFVGLKMCWLNEAFGGKFPIVWSLSIICGILAITVVTSLIADRKNSTVAN